MRGIVLAGGTGSRLRPLTTSVSKQLLPVYDKPLIYYPISTLIEGGINEILIITNPQNINLFKSLLGNGSDLGCRFEYIAQENPDGLPQAFILGEKFIGNESVALILGDNIFHGPNVSKNLRENKVTIGANVFCIQVSDPKRYGVVEFDDQGKVISIEEKPAHPKSKFALPGLYFFDSSVAEKSKSLKKSARGELEITDLIKLYQNEDKLKVISLDKGTAWFDAGTFSSLLQAGQFVETIEAHQGIKVGCIEESALKAGLISGSDFHNLMSKFKQSGYYKLGK